MTDRAITISYPLVIVKFREDLLGSIRLFVRGLTTPGWVLCHTCLLGLWLIAVKHASLRGNLVDRGRFIYVGGVVSRVKAVHGALVLHALLLMYLGLGPRDNLLDHILV